MTARQHGDAGSGRRRALEDHVGQRAAGVAGHHHVHGREWHLLYPARLEAHATAETGPGRHQRLVQRLVRGRQHRIHHQCVRRRIVEQQHHVPEQAVAAGEIDDAAAAADASHPARHLPRLEQLLARQAAGGTRRPADPVDEGVAGEPVEIVRRQPARGAMREHGRRSYSVGGAFAACGSENPTVTPPASLDAQTRPPCASTSCLTIVRPRPEPPVARLRAGSAR